MRKKIIIVSVITLIIGIALFVYGTNQYNYYKKQSETGYIEIPNTINVDELEGQMSFGKNVSYIGIIMLFIAALLMALGFYLKEN